MKKKHLLLILSAGLAALLLSACTGSRALNASSWPGVLAVEDRVYLAFNSHVYALNAGNGSTLWQFPAEPENNVTFYSAPALSADGSQLIVGGYDNTLYSLNPDTGLPVGWTFEGAGNRYIGGPLVTEEGIFAPNADGNVYALDFTGNPIWQMPYSTGEPIWSTPASDGERLYVSALDHQIHAVDMATGESIWSADLETASVGTPTLDNGNLYVGTFGKKVIALNAESGREIWSFETQDWAWASPAVLNDLVIAGDISGMLYALDAATGTEVWRFEADGGIFGKPLVLDGFIYTGTENGLFYKLNTEGEVEWFSTLTGKIYSSPAHNGEFFFVGTTEGEAILTAIDMNGAARWPFTPEE